MLLTLLDDLILAIGGVVRAMDPREQAVSIWMSIIFMVVLGYRETRGPVLSLIGFAVFSKIGILVLVIALYIAGLCVAIRQIGLFDYLVAKEVLIWAIGTGFVLVFDANKAGKDANFFQRTVRDSVRLIIAFEFLVNVHTFGLTGELFFVPGITLLALLAAIADTDERLKPARQLFQAILALVGAFLILVTALEILRVPGEFFTLNSLKEVGTAPVMTLALLPWVYLLALYMIYESIFVRLNVFMKDDAEIRGLIKRAVVFEVKLSLSKARRISGAFAYRASKVKSIRELRGLMKDFLAADTTPGFAQSD